MSQKDLNNIKILGTKEYMIDGYEVLLIIKDIATTECSYVGHSSGASMGVITIPYTRNWRQVLVHELAHWYTDRVFGVMDPKLEQEPLTQHLSNFHIWMQGPIVQTLISDVDKMYTSEVRDRHMKSIIHSWD